MACTGIVAASKPPPSIVVIHLDAVNASTEWQRKPTVGRCLSPSQLTGLQSSPKKIELDNRWGIVGLTSSVLFAIV